MKLPMKQGKITYKNAYLILLVLIWTRTSIVSYVFSTLRLFPVIGRYSDAIKIMLYLIASGLAIPYFTKKLKIRDYVFLMIVIIMYFFNVLFYTNTSDFLIENAIYILVINFSAYFIGVVMENDDDINIIYRCSQVSIIAFLLFFSIFGFQPEASRDNMENMGLAYRILPHACMVILYSLKNRKMLDVALSIISAVLVLACGVRGAIISLLAFVLVYVVIFYHFRYKWSILSVVATVSAFLAIQFDKVAVYLIILFNKFGLSTRVIETLMLGTTLEDEPRRRIKEWMFEAIQLHPYRGYGIAGDRNLIPTVVYSHAFWLEMWVSYGLLFGTIIMIVIFTVIIRAILKGNSNQVGFIVAMIFGGGLFKLIVSSSYLFEFEFFLLVGYSVGIIRRKNKNS